MIELLLLLLVVGVAAVWIYNALVQDRNLVQAGWSDIDVQLKRRHELIPRLVTCVKAYADFERATLEAVTELRTRSEQTDDLARKAAIEDAMEEGLHKVIVTVEDYPELKADDNFRQLQAELVETEDKIQYARRFYNGAVRNLNTRIESFPHLLLARPLGFRPAQFFAVDEDAERQAPAVSLR
ncbi:MAG: LemA family protein [Halioglobus sp.]|nr:LemA family protein [Halioglobus sp.]